jgi:hypothetical protein
MNTTKSQGIRRAGGRLLTAKELDFVAHWRGDAAEAVRLSSYNSTDPAKFGCYLLKKPRVVEAVLAKQAEMVRLMAAVDVKEQRE